MEHTVPTLALPCTLYGFTWFYICKSSKCIQLAVKWTYHFFHYKGWYSQFIIPFMQCIL